MKLFSWISASRLRSIGILSLAVIGTKALAFDAVTCGTEQPTFRQLCKLDGKDHSQSFELAGQSQFRGYKFDITGILRNPKLAFESVDSTINVDLLGLQPILEFDTDFTNLDACRQSTLWNDQIAVYLRLPDGAEQFASDVRLGPKHHSVTLLSSSQSPQSKYLITLTPDGSNISIETKLLFKNQDDSPGRSTSLKRIPTSCQLRVYNQKLGFDAVQINANLQTLKVYTATLDQTILKSTVLNGMYLKQKTGAVCTVEKLSATLYSIEGLALTEDPDQLSLPSQQAIADAISHAVTAGAIAEDSIAKDDFGALEYFDYYRKKENRDALKTNCQNILDELVVDKKKFLATDGTTVTNQVAYKNAEDYARGIRNLKKVVDAAWTLVSVARMDVQNSKDLEWLIDPKIYGFVGSSTPSN